MKVGTRVRINENAIFSNDETEAHFRKNKMRGVVRVDHGWIHMVEDGSMLGRAITELVSFTNQHEFEHFLPDEIEVITESE